MNLPPGRPVTTGRGVIARLRLLPLVAVVLGVALTRRTRDPDSG
jgi:hypothetical protein